MGWRTILVSGRAKLDLKLNNMVVRKEETTKVHIPEIAVLIIDSTTVSITTALIDRLVEEKVKVIFTGKDHNPIGEIVNYYNKHNSVQMIQKQINWGERIKKKVWAEIIREKIKNQASILFNIDEEAYNLLLSYIAQVEEGDLTNREGHAAKVYFNAVFGKEFTRGKDDPINSMLNFGYSILLSLFTREITSFGYLTQLGIFHQNQFNYFNLASDLMEPLRPMVDKCVYLYYPESFGTKEKYEILKINDSEVFVGERKYSLFNAVKEYCKSIFSALEQEDTNLIKFIEYEL